MFFSDITLESQPLIRPFLDAWKLELSEFSFVSMVLYQPSFKTRFAIEDDTLFICMQDKLGRHFVFAPLPLDTTREFAPLVARVRTCCAERGVPFWMRSCSAAIAERIQAEVAIRFQPVRNSFDYVYNTSDLIELSGKKYHAKRNHINKLKSMYQYEYVPYEPAYHADCMAVFGRWLEGKDRNMPGIAEEVYVVDTALCEAEALGLTGGMIRINGQIEAFSFGERIREDMALIHIEKANAEIPGLYALINQQFAQHAWHDTLYINREEDMGAAGLRKAKQSYNPAFMVEKYDSVIENSN